MISVDCNHSMNPLKVLMGKFKEEGGNYEFSVQQICPGNILSGILSFCYRTPKNLMIHFRLALYL